MSNLLLMYFVACSEPSKSSAQLLAEDTASEPSEETLDDTNHSEPSSEEDSDDPEDSEPTAEPEDSAEEDTAEEDTAEEEEDCPPDYGSVGDPFADVVVSYDPGEGAGFGQEDFPSIVLGPPMGGGENAGSLDVLSLGENGSIILEMTDGAIVDGPGADFIVFENPFWVYPIVNLLILIV